MTEATGPVAGGGPPSVAKVLEQLDALESEWHLDALLPALLDLAKQVRSALADGRVNVVEMYRIGRSLVRIVSAAQR